MNNTYRAGDWNAICDSCGFKFKAFQLKKRWDGLMVCSKDYETRHPQELLKVQEERISVPYVRPEAEDTFIRYICSVESLVPRADIAAADCARVGYSI
jgi:hypothetical protein